MNDGWIIVKLILIYVIAIPFATSLVINLFYKITKTKKDTVDEITSGLLCLVVTVILATTMGYANLIMRDYKYFTQREIVALQDNETFIISRYSADSTLYYYYMVNTSEGYKSMKADQENSVIKYTSGEPKVVVHKKESTNKFIYFMFPVKEFVGDYKYEFYLPKGSIKEEFNVDLN